MSKPDAGEPDEHDGNHLERARAELDAAREDASRVVRLELESVREGVFEEDEGDLTQAEPGPKPDRIAEMADKLDGLADQAEGATGDRIADARDSLRSHLEGRAESRPEAEGSAGH